MTTIIKKENLKNKLLREYNSLKKSMNLNSTEDEVIASLLEHLAENLFNSENYSNNRKNIKIHNRYRTKKNLEQAKDRAICSLLLHKGSFF